MIFSKFSEYYIDSIVKDPESDYVYDGSDKWFEDHKAITSNGSLLLGIIKEGIVVDIRNFIDIYILPEIFNLIKSNTNKEIVYLSNDTTNDKYIHEHICNKFPTKTFSIVKINSSVNKDIKLLENDNKIVISVLDCNIIYSIKNLIEYI